MTISTEEVYLLNKMNATASKVQLGTLIQNAETVSAGEVALAEGKVFIGNASGVAEATTLTSGQIIVGSAASKAAAVTVSGDVTISATGVTAIAGGVVVNADVSASAAIDFSKLAALASARILVGSAGNVATAVDVTGDVTISNTGVTAIGANKVTKSMLATDVMVEATGTLTQAQLLTISATVTAIAAPGAGKVIVVDEVELFHSYSTAAYATGSDLALEYGTSGDNIALVADSFVTGGASASVIIKPSTYNLDGSTGTGTGFDVTANANKPVQFQASDFTNGDVANVVKWRIRYHVVTLLT